MPKASPLLSRRHLLQTGSLVAAALAVPAWAQPNKAGSSRGLTVGQVVDFSQAQQEVSRDFLTGSRAAWQDINARGGIRGRTVQHVALETDGSAAGLRSAIDSVKGQAGCVALSGSVGDRMADQLVQLLDKEKLELAHVAPWLQNSSLNIDERTFPIFAARQQQIAYALKTLSVMGMNEIGAVYATAEDQQAYHLEVERIAASMQLKLQPFLGSGQLRALGQKLTPKTPAVLLFVGGTPELAEFTQGLAKQARQRYIVALADVNLGTMLQMGASRSTPVIATQPVPLVNSSLPIVRNYRETLARLYDEAPTTLGLAGFIAARYTAEVLGDIDAVPTRQNVLAAFQRRAGQDIGGFRVTFDTTRKSGTYVTQSMLTADGRLVG